MPLDIPLMTTLPITAAFAALPEEHTTVSDIKQIQETIDPGAASSENKEEEHTNGLIADLAWILLLGAIVTLLSRSSATWCSCFRSDWNSLSANC